MNRESPTAAQDARIARLFQSMIESAASCDSDATAAAAIVRQIADFCGCPRVHLVSGRQGRWVTLAAIGDGEPPPTTLLANAADSEEPEQLGSWVAVALPKPQRQSEVLAVDWHAEHTVHIDWLKRWVVPATATTLRLVRDRQTNAREISKLNAMLTIAAMQPDRTDAPAILEHVGNSCLAILHAKQARMFLYQPTDDRFVAVASPAAAGDADANQPGPLDGFLAREVIRTRTTRQMDVVPRVLLVPFCSPNQRFVGVVEIVAEDSERFSEAAQADAIELVKLAGRVLEHAVADGQGRPPGTTQPTSTEWRMIGDSSAMSELRAKLQRVAPTDLAVLILGENGTGKEIAASQIHHWSHRADQPFVAVNCAAISEPLLESELFGHEKGAFTDAHQARQGKFELASGGTLFLDEIGDLSAGAQAKLLRVLDEKVVIRVGGSERISTDTRVLAATNRDLAAMVRAGSFREDLFFRLSVVTLEVPPLRDRGEDIVLLARHFLRTFAAQAQRARLELAPSAEAALLRHRWSGNVRELRNLMERLAYLTTVDCIEARDLGLGQHRPADDIDELSLAEATRRFQIDYIESQIDASGGSMTTVARRLGLHRSNLYRKMRQLGMSTREDPDDDDPAGDNPAGDPAGDNPAGDNPAGDNPAGDPANE